MAIADQLFRLREIIDLLDSEKLRYFVITEFINCFTKFFQIKITPRAQESDLPFFTRICTRRLICGQPFTGHVVGVQPMKRKKKSLKSWSLFLAKVNQVWKVKKYLLVRFRLKSFDSTTLLLIFAGKAPIQQTKRIIDWEHTWVPNATRGGSRISKGGGWMADHIYWGVVEKMPWLKK